ESVRLQSGLIFERMPVTAEVSSLAPAVALLPGLPVFDSRIFGALRDSHLGSGQKEPGRGRSSTLGIFRFPLRKISFKSGSLRLVLPLQELTSFVTVLRDNRE